MKGWKRLLSVLMAAVLVFSVFTMPAFGVTQEVKDNILKIVQDVETNGTLNEEDQWYEYDLSSYFFLTNMGVLYYSPTENILDFSASLQWGNTTACDIEFDTLTGACLTPLYVYIYPDYSTNPDEVIIFASEDFDPATYTSETDLTFVEVSRTEGVTDTETDYTSDIEMISGTAFSFLEYYLSQALELSMSDIGFYGYDGVEPPVEVKGELRLEDGVYKYYEDDEWISDKYGFVEFDGGLFLVANGVVATEVDGLAQDPEHTDDWYYLSKGQAQTQYTGLVQYDGEWFYVKNGKLDTTMAAYVEYDGGLFYVGAGRIMTEVNGLAQDPNGTDWYYLANGQAQTQYTGLATYDGEWFYIVDGKLAEDYTGEVEYDGETFHVENGMVKAAEDEPAGEDEEPQVVKVI